MAVPVVFFFPMDFEGGGDYDVNWHQAKSLVGQMTLKEKLSMLYGINGSFVGNIAGNERLGIPAILMQDGPQGFRCDYAYRGTTTAMPSAMNIAATFNPSLAFSWGNGMGEEFLLKGAHVQLGPGVNVARVPLNGRNFEYISGEDPVLGMHLAKAAVEGIQRNGIIANAKHYINNNQENNRENVSANIDERTQMEIYLPPFEGAVKGGVLSAMCAYNRVNGIWACENDETLNKILKGKLGFKGWVMSDWDATHSTVQSANAGLDVEMPLDTYFGHGALEKAVLDGEVSEKLIDDKVTRILSSLYAVGIMGANSHLRPKGDFSANVTSPARNRLARVLAARSTVVVQNNNRLLPLKPSALPRGIAVLGSAAHDEPIVGGHGSGYVDPPYIITGYDGIREHVGEKSNDNPGGAVYHPTTSLAAAVQAAKDADVAIVFVATVSGEHQDRANLSYSAAEDELIFAVAAANPNTIVVATSPGHVLMPWANKVAGIVMCFLPGQEAGHAIADVLFNVLAPTAHLPITIPNKENEVGFTDEQYPGLPVEMPLNAQYSEKLEVGYRWYNAKKVKPLFCFGHGLAYTEFKYSKLSITTPTTANTQEEDPKVIVSVEIHNVGEYSSSDTPQLYLTFPSSAGEPPRQLKGFKPTTTLRPNQRQTVEFELSARDMSIWDVNVHDWALIRDEFIVEVGRSSCDLRVAGKLTPPAQWV
jgi:beta-glucosidase